MRMAYYHVDCFTENVFCGNPAAVCVLPGWLPDAILQSMAQEHNLPATAFLVADDSNYTTRWFGPDAEIPLCGHGSLAAAFVVFNFLQPAREKIIFKAPQHRVTVVRHERYVTLNLPAKQVTVAPLKDELEQVLNVKPLAVYQNGTFLALVENEHQVRNLRLNVEALRRLPCRNLIVTAPGAKVDFVSRNFYPSKQISEDPVTGSAHCILAPFWAQRLNKHRLLAQQVSARGGELICEVQEQVVLISGQAVLYKRGEIELDV